MKHRIGTTERFKRAVRAHRYRCRKRLLNWTQQRIRKDNILVAISMDVPYSKGLVAHLSEHPTLVGGIDVTIVIIDDRANANAGGAP